MPAEGIRGVGAGDVACAEKLGYSIKLLACAKRLEGERFTAFVAPMLVPRGNLLADVGGVMNAVVVTGNMVGDCLFYGAGAGRMPTASAVVADIIDAMRRGNGRKFIDWGPERPECWTAPEQVPYRWFVRCRSSCATFRAAPGRSKTFAASAGASPAAAFSASSAPPWTKPSPAPGFSAPSG